jgi:tRNA(fMet)-specific endonuclease VapC
LGILIDTSVLVALEREGAPPSAVGEALEVEPVFLAAITASELLHGVHRADSASRRGRREKFVETILETVPVLPFDLLVAREHARIWADLAQTGRLIGAHDMQIAATGIAHDLGLLTANRREFDRVEGLVVKAWGPWP